ncbi:hypothetical protein F4775DRAFT_552920 [Biscogniauxia sp. FL1348]|nr:hypothetical protein F4775DRAFT_552920 [Biscogniauxia sp. FL1348]
MRPGASESATPFEEVMKTHPGFFNKDAMDFLDDYDKRTYGESIMSLRGGGGGDDDEKDDNDDGVPIAAETTSSETPQPKPREGRIYGYQGMLAVPSLTYDAFVSRTDQLLNQRNMYDYEIRVSVFDEKGDFITTLEQAVGTVRHLLRPGEVPPSNDPIYALLQKWFPPGKPGTAALFVRFVNEEDPPVFCPFLENRNIVRIWDSKQASMSYMRVPENLSLGNYQSNQYLQDYLRAMKVLYKKPPHMYTRPGNNANGVRGLSFGLLPPPVGTWTDVGNDQAQAKIITLYLNPEIVTENIVPVLIPGFHNYITKPSKQLGGSKYPIWKKELKVNGTNADTAGLEKLVRDVKYTNTGLQKAESFTGIEAWFPSENFMNPHKRPRRIPLEKSSITTLSLPEWRSLILSWRGEQAFKANRGFSIMARPVFSEYNVRSGSGPEAFKVDIGLPKLENFKKLVKEKLFTNYDSGDKSQVLHMVQSTWSDAALPQFSIRHDTSQADWNLIVRHIVQPDITVSLQDWNNAWNVPPQEIWGPRYDTADVKKLSTFTTAKPEYDDNLWDAFFQKSKNKQETIGRDTALRQRYFWSAPTIFTNPTKPAMPLHCPPRESIIRTGPNVPGISIGMMTPTEMARLQLEVYSLRNQILDRTRECPYLDCKRYFRFDDGVGLDRHMKQDHKILQCFLCTKKTTMLGMYDTASIKKHFMETHFNELKTMFGSGGSKQLPPAKKPAPPLPPSISEQTTNHFCDRCGRNEEMLNDPADRFYHATICGVVEEGQYPLKRPHCTNCGRLLVGVVDDEGVLLANVFEPCVCGNGPEKPPPGKPRFCGICGFEFDDAADPTYRDKHQAYCKPPSGHEKDYCPHCGIGLGGLEKCERRRHEKSCEKRPPPGPPPPKGGGKGGKGTPKTPIKPDPTPKTPPPKTTTTTTSGNDEKCTYFKNCGAIVSQMTFEQMEAHLDWHKQQGDAPKEINLADTSPEMNFTTWTPPTPEFAAGEPNTTTPNTTTKPAATTTTTKKSSQQPKKKKKPTSKKGGSQATKPKSKSNAKQNAPPADSQLASTSTGESGPPPKKKKTKKSSPASNDSSSDSTTPSLGLQDWLPPASPSSSPSSDSESMDSAELWSLLGDAEGPAAAAQAAQAMPSPLLMFPAPATPHNHTILTDDRRKRKRGSNGPWDDLATDPTYPAEEDEPSEADLLTPTPTTTAGKGEEEVHRRGRKPRARVPSGRVTRSRASLPEEEMEDVTFEVGK